MSTPWIIRIIAFHVQNRMQEQIKYGSLCVREHSIPAKSLFRGEWQLRMSRSGIDRVEDAINGLASEREFICVAVRSPWKSLEQYVCFASVEANLSGERFLWPSVYQMFGSINRRVMGQGADLSLIVRSREFLWAFVFPCTQEAEMIIRFMPLIFFEC